MCNIVRIDIHQEHTHILIHAVVQNFGGSNFLNQFDFYLTLSQIMIMNTAQRKIKIKLVQKILNHKIHRC